MGTVSDVILALLAAFGIVCAGWWTFGKIVSPVGGVGPIYAVLPASGDGKELEQTVTGLLWLRGNGNIKGVSILVADCGLTPKGQYAVQLLARRMPDLQICTPEEVAQYIERRRPGGQHGAESGSGDKRHN